MKKGGFRKLTYNEALAKKQAKQAKTPKKSLKRNLGGNKVASGRKPTKSKSMAWYKKELDRVFSLWIRQKHADENGMVKCYTCEAVKHWKEMQNGHFVSRSYLATRWDENNCRPQCVGDNLFGGGKPLDFEEHLKNELGDVLVEETKKKRHTILKLDKVWYNERIQYYKTKLDELSPTPD